MKKRYSGFTLVELLIVIIIIGILAGAMMLMVMSGNEAAEAAKIVSDLRSLKAATILYYMENNDGGVPAVDPDLKEFMDRPPDVKYTIVEPVSGSLYVQFDLADVSSGVIEKLKKMKESAIEVLSGDLLVRMRVK